MKHDSNAAANPAGVGPLYAQILRLIGPANVRCPGAQGWRATQRQLRACRVAVPGSWTASA